jgi:hypothetical protein
LAKWLSVEQKVYLSLRLKCNEYVELEQQFWFQLRDLGLQPGMSLYYQGVKVTKTKGFSGLNLAAKYRRSYRNQASKEPWYILTNLEGLPAATSAYSKRMGIEEMFRDFKLGGYDLEDTQVTGERLIALILLITLAYSYSTFSGVIIKRKGVAKYVSRPTEPQRTQRRASNFSIGLSAFNWLDTLDFFQEELEQLMAACPHQQAYYRRGLRAISLIQSAF